MDVVGFLGTDDFKSLRLVGSRALALADPRLTSHLQLHMNMCPFFCDSDQFSEEFARRWLDNRGRVVIDDKDCRLSPIRVTYLVSNGFLDSVTEFVVYGHRHQEIIGAMSRLRSLKSFTFFDQADQRETLDDLEAIVGLIGNMRSLTSLDMEFNVVIHGSRLSFLRGLRGLQHVRLVGFDLSYGISFMGGLFDLTTLHLCHGNFYSSPEEDVNEKDLLELAGCKKLERIHLEGFDDLKGIGLSSWHGSMKNLAMKHCQDLSEDCLVSISQMTRLESLHLVSSSGDDIETFSEEGLQHLNTLTSLQSLSLFYMIDEITHLQPLPGLTALRTLNLAFEDPLCNDELEMVCTQALRTFPSLQKLRIFSEEGMDTTFQHGHQLEVETATFTFGDLVYLD